MRPVFVLSAARTPIGRFGGTFASLSAADLGEVAARAAIERSGLAARGGRRDDLRPRPPGGRRPQHRPAGLAPRRRPGLGPRVHREQGVRLVARRRSRSARCRSRPGENDVVLAGGTECMSATPYLLHARALRLSDGKRRGRRRDVPRRLSLSALRPADGRDGREPRPGVRDPPRRAGRVRRRVAAARGGGDPRPGASPTRSRRSRSPGRKGPRRSSSRTSTRAPTRPPESLAKLPPVFDPETGTVTRATRPGSPTGPRRWSWRRRRRSAAAGVEPLARVVAWTSAGVEPARMGIGPVPAVRALLAEDEARALRRRPHRAERGLRRAGHRLRPGAAARSVARQRQRRRDRARPSDRRDRRAHRDDAAPRDEAPEARSAASRRSACPAAWGWPCSSNAVDSLYNLPPCASL